MDNLVEDIRVSIKNKETNKIIEYVNEYLSHCNDITLSNPNLFDLLLKYDYNDVLKLTMQVIAELAKFKENRECLTVEHIIKQILPHLESTDCGVSLQTCRALGNICFENDNARKMINVDGLKLLTTLLQTTLNVKSFDSKLISTCCGCLMNLVMENDELQKALLEFKILESLESILKHNLIDFDSSEDCTTHTLIIINILTDHLMDDWLSPSLCSLLADILRISMNAEISALCLEILRSQCENDSIKLCLAKKGTCELVYDLIERHGIHVDDEESRYVLKMACDLIVLILTGDDSMNILYDDGKGAVYEQMISWLNSEDNDLLCTGILAIGNFARNDHHCIEMVENGLAKKLLGILKYYSSDGDTKVLHALLSTLRNLCIPPENKSKLLNENLVDILVSMLNVDHSPVEFKLLGTLRMVVDGQEKTANELISKQEFIEKLVHWCYNSDHLGVRGEAPRLLAWLIKNCHMKTCYSTVLSVHNSIKCLVEMMSSMHALMQNEAIMALNILCSNCLNNDLKSSTNNKSLSELLVEAQIGKNLVSLVSKSCEKMLPESLDLFLAFITQLVNNEKTLKDLREQKLSVDFSNFAKTCKYPKIVDKIGQIKFVLETK